MTLEDATRIVLCGPQPGDNTLIPPLERQPYESDPDYAYRTRQAIIAAARETLSAFLADLELLSHSLNERLKQTQ